MSIFDKPFNPDDHRSETQPGEYADDPIIPEGYHSALLVDTKEGLSRTGAPWFMFKWQLTSGPGKGTKVSIFDNPSHKDGGEKAVNAGRIFRGRLASYCDAVGLGVIQDPSELHNKPVKVHFKPWTREDGSVVNQVTHYKAINDASAALSTKKPFFPKAASTAPTRSAVQAQNAFHQSAADAEDAEGADFEDDIPF